MFLHGWGCDHKTLMPFINKLKQTHKCVCFDFFGFGKNKKQTKPLCLKDFEKAVVCELKKLGISKFGIVAHSFGARVAILLACDENVSVEKMFFVGPAGIKPKFSLKKFFKIKAFKFLKFLSKIGLYKKEKLMRWGSSDFKALSPPMRKTFINVISQNLKPMLKKIKCETFVCIGENDKETPIYMGRIMQKEIENCHFEIIKDAGHFCFLEKTDVIFLAYYFFK